MKRVDSAQFLWSALAALALLSLGCASVGDKAKSGVPRKAEQKNASEKLLNILTADQMAKWRELAGEPFNGELPFGHRCWRGSSSSKSDRRKPDDRRAERP